VCLKAKVNHDDIHNHADAWSIHVASTWELLVENRMQFLEMSVEIECDDDDIT